MSSGFRRGGVRWSGSRGASGELPVQRGSGCRGDCRGRSTEGDGRAGDRGHSLRYEQQATEYEVTLEPAERAVASVILLHGLGADGWDFVPIVGELGLSLPVRFIFPHAPERPVTSPG